MACLINCFLKKSRTSESDQVEVRDDPGSATYRLSTWADYFLSTTQFPHVEFSNHNV